MRRNPEVKDAAERMRDWRLRNKKALKAARKVATALVRCRASLASARVQAGERDKRLAAVAARLRECLTMYASKHSVDPSKRLAVMLGLSETKLQALIDFEEYTEMEGKS